MPVALAAPHHVAVDAGRRVAEAGGNALDAALAAAVMLTVVYPHQCAIGGDLIALVRSPDGRTRAVLGAGTAPAAIEEAATGWTTVPRFGEAAVTVPGMVSGWQAIAALSARRPLAAAFDAAAAVAEDGVPVSAGLARALAAQADAVRSDPGMRSIFSSDGAPLREADALRQPALAATLRRLAIDPADFYTGQTAAAMLEALRAAGGVHSTDDFAGYSAEVVDALEHGAHGMRWSVAPPPSAGAVLLGVVGAPDAGSATGLVDASIRGVASRAAHLGDIAADSPHVAALLSLADGDVDAMREPRPTGDTAAVVASDDEGWAVTIVQSVYFTFGAQLLDPATGVLFHNRGSAFSTDPASPAALRGGARPPHTLTPAIIDTDAATVVAGCQGGRAQPWILAQLLPETPDAPSLDEVLARPRWVVGAQDLGHDALTVVTEPGVDPRIPAHAERLGIPHAAWPSPADEAGHVQLVRRRGGRLDAASDPRADGAAIVV
ncbi:gamma-glutamyltransferase [Microbacterium sp. NPDC091313]